MLTIRFRFVAGRYHSTPWNRQVNEGVIEWPPNPWRIIRGMLAVYHTKEKEFNDDDILMSLIEKISSPPLYELPPASIGHTRHYMPLYREGKTSKIFDTFAAVSKDDMLKISWKDIELEKEEELLLRNLLDKMTYLGRAESWVEADVIADDISPNCIPVGLEDEHSISGKREIVDVLVPLNEQRYKEWIEGYDKSAKKKLKGLKTIKDALCIETSQIKKDGWSQPPGSEWVQYSRPLDCFEVKPIHHYEGKDGIDPIVARFAVSSKAPPRLTEAISVSDRVHKSLVKYSDNSSVFTGCDDDGNPLSGHQHAHIICESNPTLGGGVRGEITHISIYAPMGFGFKERKALDMLKKVWGHGGNDINLVLVGIGQPEDFGGTDTATGRTPLMYESRVWESRTPFIPTRHPKTTRAGVPKVDENGLQIGSPEHDLVRLLVENGYPMPESINGIDSTDLGGHSTRWLHFRRDRKDGEGAKSTNMGFGFRLVFPEPVKGPIALGYGAHFGLGCFVALDDE